MNSLPLVDEEGSGRIEGMISFVLWAGVPGSEKGANFARGRLLEATTRHRKLPISAAETDSWRRKNLLWAILRV